MSRTKFGFIIGLFVVSITCYVHVESVQITITETLTSCTNQLLFPELPNLSHAKSYSQLILPSFSCNQTELTSFNRSYTWYYHSVYPVPGGCPDNQCCFDTATSIASFTTVLREFVNGNSVITRTGTIISGPYTNKTVTGVQVSPLVDQTACTSAPGLQIVGSVLTMTILGGPKCSGIQVGEDCPGLH